MWPLHWQAYILTLPAGVPFRYMRTLSLLLTVSFLSSPRLPSTDQVPTTARLSSLHTSPHHLLTSSAKVLLFWCFPLVNPSNRKGLTEDPLRRPTSTAKGSLVPAAHLTTFSHWWYISFPVWCTSLSTWPLVSHAPIQSFHRYSVLCYTLSSSLRFVMGEVLPATSSPPHLIVISASSVSCLLLPVFLLSCVPHISLNAVLPSQSWSPSSPPALLTELCRSLR